MAILTVAELRKHISYPTGVDADAALQRWLNAAEADILVRLPAGAERHTSDGVFIYPHYPVGSVTTITETVGATVTTLAANDYAIRHGGWALERLVTGTNQRGQWTGAVSLTYVPVVDAAIREVVQIDLVKLDINHESGLTARTIGDWSEAFANNSVMNYGLERELILDRLTGSRAVVLA